MKMNWKEEWPLYAICILLIVIVGAVALDQLLQAATPGWGLL